MELDERVRRLEDRAEVTVKEWCHENTQEYSDGSRLNGAAAAGTTRTAEYIGRYATVMGAELLGIRLALEAGHNSVALDSQAVITRAESLYTEPSRSWIELRLQEAIRGACLLAWVKGHAGIEWNMQADRRANLRGYGGRVMGLTDVMTPAGIRQDFPIHSKPKHLKWPRKAVRGLTWITTDRGPMKN